MEHLASHILGRMASRISADWQRIYGHPIYFLETFVDPERFRGTCYRAANWVVLGKTTGRGKQSNSYVPNRSIKDVLGYPLTKQFRELLMEARMRNCEYSRLGSVNLDELGPGAGRSAASAVERGRLREAQGGIACAGGDVGAAAQSTEKTSAVVGKSEGAETDAGTEPKSNTASPAPGHGRNGRRGVCQQARKVAIAHPQLKHGDRCPECEKRQRIPAEKEPKVLVRIVGQAPLARPPFSRSERLRCGACGQVFTAHKNRKE